jgi:hypothetical protein
VAFALTGVSQGAHADDNTVYVNRPGFHGGPVV